MEEKLNELIKIYVAPFLKSLGFKKQKHYFYKTDSDFTFSINFPVDREYTENGAFVWLICGIYSAEFEGMMGREIKLKPIGYDNIFSHNFSTIIGKTDDRLLIEKTSDLAILGEEMTIILEKIMVFYSTINSLDGLMNHCLEHNYLVHHEDLLRYLAIKKDEKLTAFYFSKIKERLQGIADRAFESYKKRFEDFRMEIKNDLKIEIDSEWHDKNIRKITKADYPLLEAFLYLAIYIPEGSPQLNKSITFQPELYHYIEDFGNIHDLGFVVESNKNVIGAIWTRIFTEEQKGYGFVDSETPELSMAINPDFRSQGFGSKLMENMMLKLQECGYKQVSLSVDNRNFAYQLYLKFGFQEVKVEGNSVVMVKVL